MAPGRKVSTRPTCRERCGLEWDHPDVEPSPDGQGIQLHVPGAEECGSFTPSSGRSRTSSRRRGPATRRKGIVTEDQASARPERRDALAKSIYAAGHHTTFQHAHFQFALENVSRQFLWTFLHSHPFYNSEQVSQRYVEVKRGNYAVPPMGPAERDLFEKTALAQQEAYERLTRVS